MEAPAASPTDGMQHYSSSISWTIQAFCRMKASRAIVMQTHTSGQRWRSSPAILPESRRKGGI